MSHELSADSATLLRQARAGNVSDQGRLLEHYRNYLTLLARLQIGPRLRGKVDATDIVQDTFLKAHRDFGEFRGATEEELLNWLRQILACSLAMVVRHYFGTQRRDIRLECGLDMDQSSQILDRGLMADDSSPSQQVVRHEQGVLLANALEQLPADYREVILLRHMEGWSFPEIAEQMNRSLDSVKKLWTRALIQLRRSMGNQQIDHD